MVHSETNVCRKFIISCRWAGSGKRTLSDLSTKSVFTLINLCNQLIWLIIAVLLRAFLPQCVVDDNGEPTDRLSPEALDFCRRLGVNATKVSEVIGNKEAAVYNAIQEGLERVNAKATSNAQKVQKFVVLERDFSIAGGELGQWWSRAKVKRKECSAPAVITSFLFVCFFVFLSDAPCSSATFQSRLNHSPLNTIWAAALRHNGVSFVCLFFTT